MVAAKCDKERHREADGSTLDCLEGRRVESVKSGFSALY